MRGAYCRNYSPTDFVSQLEQHSDSTHRLQFHQQNWNLIVDTLSPLRKWRNPSLLEKSHVRGRVRNGTLVGTVSSL